MTGYTVHYSSNGVTHPPLHLSSTSTSIEISLLNGSTYSISVEATSEELSGESDPMTITLCECVDLLSQLLETVFCACIINYHELRMNIVRPN